MTDFLRLLSRKWTSEWEDDQLSSYDPALLDKISYMQDRLFDQFAPCLHGYAKFPQRLENWIRNVEDESDQKLLVQLVPKLFFVGQKEIDALCRQAFVGPFTHWFYRQLNLSWESDGLDESFQEFIDSTWFCPLTDSFPIAHFCHINKITGQTHRPDWRSLQKLGDPEKISLFMNNSGLKRIVVLEDFVGTGKQMKSALQFVLGRLTNSPEVLFIPLVITYVGDEKAKLIKASNASFSYSPLITIREEECLKLEPASEPDLRHPYEKALVSLLDRVHSRLGEFKHADEDKPLGFKNNGALIVMYSNCPSNTPPTISKNSAAWVPLFPRVSRS